MKLFFILLYSISIFFSQASEIQKYNSSINEAKSTFANQTCLLKISESPEIYGIKLGMNIEQIEGRFPNLNIYPQDKFGVRYSFFYVDNNSPYRKQFPKNVFKIAMTFLNDRLVQFRVGYYSSKR